MATTGTVSTTPFPTRKVIDLACQKCRLAPAQITVEVIDNALDLLYLFLSTLASRGIALWRIEKQIIGLYENVGHVSLPVGTVDLLNANLRIPTRVTGTASSSEGTAANAFDGDIDTACTQVTPGGYIQAALTDAVAVPIFGILPNASGAWTISIQVSQDGVTWTTLETRSFTAAAQEWEWFDIDGVIDWSYYRLQAGGSTTLDVAELYFGNQPQSIPMALINRDDYYNLNNKFFPGRPVQYWYNKQRAQPIMEIWPIPQFQFTFAQIVTSVQMYVQDVGTMRDDLDIPQRWFLAVVCELARQLARVRKEVSPDLIPSLDQEASYQLRMAWDSETDSSPAFLRPNISPYTR